MRFASLLEDCGNTESPGIPDIPEGRDWSHRPTTKDQRRIERFLDGFDLRGKRILHIGIGNSSLARRFYREADEIVGISIDVPEIETARGLLFQNYNPIFHNKYSDDVEIVPGRFDFIADNNPNSFCCCVRHLEALFRFYDAKLAEGGLILADRQGVGWVPHGVLERFRFDFDDLSIFAAAAGFETSRAGRNIYVLSRANASSQASRSFFRSLIGWAKPSRPETPSAPRGNQEPWV